MQDNTVIHTITSHKNLTNVTIRDYLPLDSKIKNKELKQADYYGGKYELVEANIGLMSENEQKKIGYEIIKAKGSALFGADIYTIKDEMHKLNPKKELVSVGKSDFRIPLIFVLVFLIAFALIWRMRKK